MAKRKASGASRAASSPEKPARRGRRAPRSEEEGRRPEKRFQIEGPQPAEGRESQRKRPQDRLVRHLHAGNPPPGQPP